MDQLLLKAAATATDAGFFEAIISSDSVDREKDIVDPSAMVDSFAKWAGVGKRVPLMWAHSREPQHQIGYVEPETAVAQDGKVIVRGWIDQDTEVGAHAWRMVKAGTLGFSFVAGILDSQKRAGGGLHITGVDILEVTATQTPMNNDTRVLSFKALQDVQHDLIDLQRRIVELDAHQLSVFKETVKALLDSAAKPADVTENPSVDPQPRSEEPERRHVSASEPPSPEDTRADAMRRAFEDMSWQFVETGRP